MGRPKTFNELDEAMSFFPGSSHKKVERLIERAMRKELKVNRARTKAKLMDRGAQRLAQSATRYVAKQLTGMLSLRGAAPRQAPSIKQKAPDTGGRPFHFAHSHVSRATEPRKGGASSRGGGSGGGIEIGPDVGDQRSSTTRSGGKAATVAKAGRSAAHMRYIERAGAVEMGREGVDGREGLPGEERAVDGPVKDVGTGIPFGKRGRGAVAGVDEGREPGDGERLGGTSAPAGQAYVEEPRKLENGEKVVFSFGTIGDTFEERVRFWEALEVNERNENGRVQDRLIVELPHEATGEQRHAMMRAFAKEFEGRGLPFWAAMHAPGDRNDSRNFHAHIVYSSRPAVKMIDPADGVERWDFEVVESYKTGSRHTRTRHPHRQKRCAEMEKADAIPKLRRAFAEAVNAVLVGGDVRDAKGEPVRYDARSYKDMGVDVVPMRTINRIVADKLREGRLTVLDDGHTRKMIEAELREARGRRDKDLRELARMGTAIENWARAPGDRGAASALPAALRPRKWAKPSTSVIRKVGKALLEARHAAYAQELMDKSARATLDRIVEATSPESLAKPLVRRKAWEEPVAPPDREIAARLHAEAVEARRLHDAEAEENGRRLRLRIGRALNAWSAATSAPAPGVAPLSEGARLAQEEAGLRAARGARAIVRDRAAVLEAERRARETGRGAASTLGGVPTGPRAWDVAGDIHDEAQATARKARPEGRDPAAASAAAVGAPRPSSGGVDDGPAPVRGKPVIPTGPGSWEVAGAATVARSMDGADGVVPPRPARPPSGPAVGALGGRAEASPPVGTPVPGPNPSGSDDGGRGAAVAGKTAGTGPTSAGAAAAAGARDAMRSGAGSKGRKPGDVLTRWGVVRAEDAAQAVTAARRRIDAVMAGLRSIADPEDRWRAIEALANGGAAKVLAAGTTPEERTMYAAVSASGVKGDARTMVDGMVAGIKARGGVVATMDGAGTDGTRDVAPRGVVEGKPVDRPATGEGPVRGDGGVAGTAMPSEAAPVDPTAVAGPAPARDVLAGGAAAPATVEVPAFAGPRLDEEEEARVAAAAAKAAAEKARRRRQAVLSRRGRGGRGL